MSFMLQTLQRSSIFGVLARSMSTEAAPAAASAASAASTTPAPPAPSQSVNTTPSSSTVKNTAANRNDPLVEQLVNTLMRDGKKMRAQRLVSDAMAELKKLYEDEDPYVVLNEAIDQASPLLKLTSTKRGGAKLVHVPTPLRLRQRRRRAIIWTLEAARRRNETTFEQRFAAELNNIRLGTSEVLAKKAQLHKQALANRANANVSYNTQAR